MKSNLFTNARMPSGCDRFDPWQMEVMRHVSSIGISELFQVPLPISLTAHCHSERACEPRNLSTQSKAANQRKTSLGWVMPKAARNPKRHERSFDSFLAQDDNTCETLGYQFTQWNFSRFRYLAPFVAEFGRIPGSPLRPNPVTSPT